MASQKRAISVCSAVRRRAALAAQSLDLVVVARPLASELGGGPGRNWAALVINQGLRCGQCGTASITVGT